MGSKRASYRASQRLMINRRLPWRKVPGPEWQRARARQEPLKEVPSPEFPNFTSGPRCPCGTAQVVSIATATLQGPMDPCSGRRGGGGRGGRVSSQSLNTPSQSHGAGWAPRPEGAEAPSEAPANSFLPAPVLIVQGLNWVPGNSSGYLKSKVPLPPPAMERPWVNRGQSLCGSSSAFRLNPAALTTRENGQDKE